MAADTNAIMMMVQDKLPKDRKYDNPTGQARHAFSE